MPYTREQINHVSATYRAEQCIEVALDLLRFYDAVNRGMIDEYSGEVIVDEPFVCHEPPKFNRRLFRYMPGKEHLYVDEHNARLDGWEECEECGTWYNDQYGFDDVPEVYGRDLCCADCAESAGYRQCNQCGDWMDADDMLFIEEWRETLWFCDEGCAQNYGFVQCEHDGCGHWTQDTWTVNVNGYDEEWCEDCHDNSSIECDGCGNRFYEEDMHHEWSTGCDWCDECWESRREPEWDWDPEIVFFDDGGVHDEPQGTLPYIAWELETDNGDNRPSYVDALRDVDGFTEHCWVGDDGSLDCGVEIKALPMSLSYHWALYESGFYDGISKAAERYGFKSHDARSSCGLHITINNEAFGLSKKAQEVNIFKLMRLTQRYASQFKTFARRSNTYYCEYDTREWFKPAPVKVSVHTHSNGDGIVAKSKRFMENERDKYRAVNICHPHHVEIRIFRGTLKWSTFLASLALVEGLALTVREHGSEWVESVSWYGLIEEVIEHVSADGPREMLADYLADKGLR